MEYGQRVRHFRALRNMTQQELAVHTGIPSTAISRIETHDRNMTLDEAVRIAKALGVTLDDLTGEDHGGPGRSDVLPGALVQHLLQEYSPEAWQAVSELALALKQMSSSEPLHSFLFSRYCHIPVRPWSRCSPMLPCSPALAYAG